MAQREKNKTEDGGDIIRKGSFVWWFRRLMGLVGAMLFGLFLAALFGGEELLKGPMALVAMGVNAIAYVFFLRKIIFGEEKDVRYNDEV